MHAGKRRESLAGAKNLVYSPLSEVKDHRG